MKFYIIFKKNAKKLLALLCLFSLSFCLYGNDKKGFSKSYYGSILSGQIANYSNQSDIASEYLDFANKFNPKNKKVYNLSLMSLILSGKVDDAIDKVKLYQNYEEKNKYETQITDLLLLINLIKDSKNKEALEFIDNKKDILITDKIKPLLKAWLSDSFKVAKRYLDEYEYKTEGLSLSNIYFHHLALISSHFGFDEEAYKAYNEGLKNFTLEKTRTLYFYSRFLSKHPQYKDKDNILEKFHKSNPDHSFAIFKNNKNKNNIDIDNFKSGIAELLYNMAETLYGQGMNDTSIAFAQISLYLNENNPIAHFILAENYQLMGQKKKAINTLKKISLNSYLGWNSYLKIADLYVDLENYELAKDYLLRLKDQKSTGFDVYYKLGELYHAQKKYKKAIYFFSRCIELIKNPKRNHWYIYYSRGMSYERSNKWNEAEKDFLFSLELFPNQPLVLNYLGYSWIDYGKNLIEAKKLIRKAVQLRPKDGYFIDSLGWAFYRMGDYTNAVKELERAVEIVPNDPIINDHLGDALWRAGYENEAIFQWKRALIYKPENDLKEAIMYKLRKGL